MKDKLLALVLTLVSTLAISSVAWAWSIDRKVVRLECVPALLAEMNQKLDEVRMDMAVVKYKLDVLEAQHASKGRIEN